MFSWNIELNSITKKELDIDLIKFYEQLQNQANMLLARIAPDNFLNSISKLNGIDEQCQLLFFYLSDDYYLERNSELIKLIKNSYQKSYLEKIDTRVSYMDTSLLFKIS